MVVFKLESTITMLLFTLCNLLFWALKYYKCSLKLCLWIFEQRRSISNWIVLILSINSISTWLFLLEDLITWKNTLLCFCLTIMLLDANAFVGVARTLTKKWHFYCLVVVIYFQINEWTTLHFCLNCLHLHFEHLAFHVTTYNLHFIMCLLCWWFVNSISFNIHILGMQRNIHGLSPWKVSIKS
jgi:hypothetical protein